MKKYDSNDEEGLHDRRGHHKTDDKVDELERLRRENLRLKRQIEEKENIELAELIREYDDRFYHILGYRRMTVWINHFNGKNYNKNRIHRIMKKLVFQTFDKAIVASPEANPVFHSDRDFQYTSKVFQAKLRENKMEQSMSHVGRCIDNGPTEGLWGIIKSEMCCMYEVTDEKSLRKSIESYIKFYNSERPQKRYGCKTPAEVRTEVLETNTPIQYPIPENKRIEKYKSKWIA